MSTNTTSMPLSDSGNITLMSSPSLDLDDIPMAQRCGMASSTASPSSPAFTYPDESDPLSYIIENGFSDGTWGESLALWFATTLTSDSGLNTHLLALIRKGDSPNEAMALAVLLCSNGILCGMAKDAEAAVTRRQQELEYAEEELKTMNIAVEKMERKAAELETEKRRVKRRVKKLEKVLWRRVEGLE